MAQELDKAIAAAKSRGIVVDQIVEKILQFFSEKSLVTFFPSGFGHTPPDRIEKLSKELKLETHLVAAAVRKLSDVGILEETKGMSSVSGKEYWFGLSENLNTNCRRS